MDMAVPIRTMVTVCWQGTHTIHRPGGIDHDPPKYWLVHYGQKNFSVILPTLKYRRLHGDMIEVFKITHNNIHDEAVSPHLPFYTRANTRGNNYKLINRSFHYDISTHFSVNVLLIFGTVCPTQYLMLALLEHQKHD